jgi:hypothetical protein
MEMAVYIPHRGRLRETQALPKRGRMPAARDGSLWLFLLAQLRGRRQGHR